MQKSMHDLAYKTIFADLLNSKLFHPELCDCFWTPLPSADEMTFLRDKLLQLDLPISFESYDITTAIDCAKRIPDPAQLAFRMVDFISKLSVFLQTLVELKLIDDRRYFELVRKFFDLGFPIIGNQECLFDSLRRDLQASIDFAAIIYREYFEFSSLEKMSEGDTFRISSAPYFDLNLWYPFFGKLVTRLSQSKGHNLVLFEKLLLSLDASEQNSDELISSSFSLSDSSEEALTSLCINPSEFLPPLSDFFDARSFYLFQVFFKQKKYKLVLFMYNNFFYRITNKVVQNKVLPLVLFALASIFEETKVSNFDLCCKLLSAFIYYDCNFQDSLFDPQMSRFVFLQVSRILLTPVSNFDFETCIDINDLTTPWTFFHLSNILKLLAACTCSISQFNIQSILTFFVNEDKMVPLRHFLELVTKGSSSFFKENENSLILPSNKGFSFPPEFSLVIVNHYASVFSDPNIFPDHAALLFENLKLFLLKQNRFDLLTQILCIQTGVSKNVSPNVPLLLCTIYQLYLSGNLDAAHVLLENLKLQSEWNECKSAKERSDLLMISFLCQGQNVSNLLLKLDLSTLSRTLLQDLIQISTHLVKRGVFLNSKVSCLDVAQKVAVSSFRQLQSCFKLNELDVSLMMNFYLTFGNYDAGLDLCDTFYTEFGIATPLSLYPLWKISLAQLDACTWSNVEPLIIDRLSLLPSTPLSVGELKDFLETCEKLNQKNYWYQILMQVFDLEEPSVENESISIPILVSWKLSMISRHSYNSRKKDSEWVSAFASRQFRSAEMLRSLHPNVQSYVFKIHPAPPVFELFAHFSTNIDVLDLFSLDAENHRLPIFREGLGRSPELTPIQFADDVESLCATLCKLEKESVIFDFMALQVRVKALLPSL